MAPSSSLKLMLWPSALAVKTSKKQSAMVNGCFVEIFIEVKFG